MAHYLPPTLMTYFQPRPPLDYVPPHDSSKTPLPAITGVAGYLPLLSAYEASTALPPPQQTKQQRSAQQRATAVRRHSHHLAARKRKWNPRNNAAATKDAYHTLFVGRLDYRLSAEDLQKEFEYYGPIVQAAVVKDKEGKSRGYGFVEFHHAADMTAAYKDADGRRLGSRRVVVDVERGRTVKGWQPRRLGGGLGATRLGGEAVNRVWSGRDGGKELTAAERNPGASKPVEQPTADKRVHNDRASFISGGPSSGQAERRAADDSSRYGDKERDRGAAAAGRGRDSDKYRSERRDDGRGSDHSGGVRDSGRDSGGYSGRGYSDRGSDRRSDRGGSDRYRSER